MTERDGNWRGGFGGGRERNKRRSETENDSFFRDVLARARALSFLLHCSFVYHGREAGGGEGEMERKEFGRYKLALLYCVCTVDYSSAVQCRPASQHAEISARRTCPDNKDQGTDGRRQPNINHDGRRPRRAALFSYPTSDDLQQTYTIPT